MKNLAALQGRVIVTQMLGKAGPAIAPSRVTVDLDGDRRRGLLRAKRNRRVAIQRRAPLVVVADGVGSMGRWLARPVRVLAKLTLVLAVMAAGVFGLYQAGEHVLASPRFALQAIIVSPTRHLSRSDVLELAGVSEGDRLLAIDTDAVAARLAAHPWVAAARVRRQLPSALSIEVDEHRAVALAVMGALYLIDENGRPFKRATAEEAEGLPAITGVSREKFSAARDVGEAALREALALLRVWRSQPNRPALSEISLDPRVGFSMFLLDGGTELRIGRGNFSKKLARFDRILEAVNGAGVETAKVVKVVHLDGPDERRIAVKLDRPIHAGDGGTAGATDGNKH